MATSKKVIVVLALSEYKRLLDKYTVLLQPANTVDEEETQRCRRYHIFSFFFFLCISGQPSLNVNSGFVLNVRLSELEI